MASNTHKIETLTNYRLYSPHLHHQFLERFKTSQNTSKLNLCIQK